MKKLACNILVLLCCAAAAALAHDPRTTAKEFSHGLKIEGAGDLNLIYKAMHFNEATYKRMQADEKLRTQMNSRVWSNIGSADAGFDLALGDQSIAKGKYTLGLSIDANDQFAVVLNAGGNAIKIPLKISSENPDLPFLTFAIYPTDKPEMFVLEGRCGKYRGTVDLKVPYLAEHAHPAAKQ
jgi:hypothetical protein